MNTEQLLKHVAGITWALWLSTLATEVVATTTNPAKLQPLRPVDSSSPFTFQQSIPDLPNDIIRKYRAIDTSGSATCAIRSKDLGIDCWGLNEFGQASPPIKGKFKYLSMGGSVGCALTTGNRLLCWGQDTSRPREDQARERYISVSAGEGHVCAIRAGNHRVDCWGSNDHGQLNSPSGAFKSISSRNNKSCGLRVSGELECWGDSAFMNYPRPTGKFKDVSVGTLHGCAVRSDNGSLACWGNGFYGEDLAPSGRFKSVTSGTDHTCGLLITNTAVCWGRNQWGQLNIPKGIKISSLNAGGAQTCGLDNSRKLLCRGSFATGDATPAQAESLLYPISSEGIRPQAAVIDDIVGDVVTNFVANIFVKWGDSIDGTMGDTLLFIGGLLGASSEKATIEKLQAIQNQLDALAQSLSNVDKKASVILSDLKTLQCDDKLGDLDTAVVNIRAAMRLYQGNGVLTDPGSYMALVRNELTKAQQSGYIPTDLRPSMRQFVSDWYAKVADDMARIDAVLMNTNYKTGPLGVCLDKAYMAYQNRTDDKQFDDRRIWKGIYWVIKKAMVDQAQGAQMLLDMNKFSVITALSDPAVESSIEPIPEGIEWHTTTLCKDVKAHSSRAAANRRWELALQGCQRNENITRMLYRNLVQQIELAGAPYSDKDVMLSMGSDLLGKGTAKDNALWLRSFSPEVSGLRKMHYDWMMTAEGTELEGHGDAKLYFSEGDRDKLGTWRADGNIWSDIFQNAQAAGYNPDRVSMMADAKSDIDDSTIFNSSIKGILFWMTGSTYRMDWRVVMGVSGDDAFKADAKCFVGSGIGKVCSSSEFSQLWGGGCHITGNDYFPTRVTYKACGWTEKYKQLMLDYRLGDISLEYWYRPLAEYDTDSYFSKVIQSPNLFPDSTSPELYRMPVLLVKYRTCTPAMVVANQDKTRENFRLVAGNDGSSRELPTRCGTDLDYFIDKMVKRPDVPELEQLVRKPVYPAGVN
jgi:hypothetical protein